MRGAASHVRGAWLGVAVGIVAAAGCYSSDRGSPVGALPAESRRAVQRAPVDVLLLPERWASASVVTAGPRWYAVSARDGELSVGLHASDVVHGSVSENVPAPRHRVRGRPARVTLNEGVRSVAWQEGDVFYVVEVECYRGEADPRCGKAGFVLKLANSLIEVGR